MSNIIVKTDQSGANDPINISSSKIFNFTIGTSNTINEGTFEIKRGSGSTNGGPYTVDLEILEENGLIKLYNID